MPDQKNIEKAFGEVLREERKRIGLSQEKLAFESGIDRTFISLMERGIRQPTLKTIIAVSTALNVKPSKLLGRLESRIELG